MARSGVTLEDIAQKTGVSPSSVWKAINDRPDVSEATRKKVLQVAQSLEYGRKTPLTMRRETGLRKIGLVYYDSDQEIELTGIYARLIAAIEREIHESLEGELTIKFVGEEFPHSNQKNLADGLIVTKRPNAEQLEKLANIPFVVCPNSPANGDNFNCVLQSNENGADLATRRLIQLGHRKIAFVAHTCKITPFQERYFGYLRVIRSEGLLEYLFADDRKIIECSHELCRQVIDSGCTAVVAASDLAARCLIEDLTAAGRRVPDDISIIGWDNHSGDSWRGPKISSIDGNLEQIGREAVRLLTRLHAVGGAEEPPVHIYVTPTLIEGATIAPAQE